MSATIWFLQSEKMGDNAQVLPILEALGLPWTAKRLFVQPQWRLGKPPFEIHLDHLDLARSDPLAPPWPDLVITSGRRMAMAALWIQEQSGGRTKLVYVGRPRRWIERFDLVVGAAQYRLPEAANVLQLDLPLMRPDRQAVEAAGQVWRSRLADLPRPLIAVLVGGQTKPFRLDAKVALDLIAAAQSEAARRGGSLYFTTSRRTRPEVAEAIEQNLPAGARLFRWQPDSKREDNPYLGLLALADAFIVTGDSASMMVEVARLRRPLAIFPLPVEATLPRRAYMLMGKLFHSTPRHQHRWWARPLRAIGNFLYDTVGLPYSRDLTMLHDTLIHRGMAVRIGQPLPDRVGAVEDELETAASRVRRLLVSAEASPA
jgi:mitochondrial fission protein ELM1